MYQQGTLMFITVFPPPKLGAKMTVREKKREKKTRREKKKIGGRGEREEKTEKKGEALRRLAGGKFLEEFLTIPEICFVFPGAFRRRVSFPID